MNKCLSILMLLLITCAQRLTAQSAKGSIAGNVLSKGTPVEWANVGLLQTSLGNATNEEGRFEITKVPAGTYTLEVSALGYKKKQQAVEVKPGESLQLTIELEESMSELDAVVISGTMKEVSRLESPVPVEVFSPVYFQKNPTPSLFESIQIVNGVRPQVNCSVCNTGDIHINGMEGPYTMVLVDGMPIVGGLASVYGLNGIPNSLIERLEVVKGPASTLYGSEAVGGLINVITKTPEKAPLVAVDVMGTDWLEFNTDLAVKANLGKASTIVGLNYFNYTNALDKNGDNFTDVTLQNRLSLFNKWNFSRRNDRVASLAARFVYEDRWGGDMAWTKAHRGGDELYGESIYTTRYEMIGKYQLPVEDENLFLNFSLSNHQQDSYYGDLAYMAEERIAFGQLTWDKTFGKHDALFGLATRLTFYDDNTPATRVGEEGSANEPSVVTLPGIFIQDEITFDEKKKLLAGIRYDQHPEHGSIFSPRLNFKWTPDPVNIFRLSIGNGFRVVNLFTEEHAAVSGDRQVVITEELMPEKSYNANLNYQRFFETSWGMISLDATAFYTYFTNKILADYEVNDNQIVYDNIDGYAVSNGISLNTDWSFRIPLKINAGVTLMDVYEMDRLGGELVKERQLLTEQVTGTYTVSYTFERAGVSLDYSGNLYGPMKLPVLENDYRPEFSPWFSIQNIQLAKTFKSGLTLYGGIKNLLDFTPRADSIMRPFDPFDKNVDDPLSNPNGYTFDAGYVYASNQGIRGFFGLRYQLY